MIPKVNFLSSSSRVPLSEPEGKKQLLHNLFFAFDIMKRRRQNGELHYPKMLITISTELRHLDYKQCIENSRIIHEQKTSHTNTAGHFNTGRMVLRITWANAPVKVNSSLRQPQPGKSGDIRGTKSNVLHRKLSQYAGSWTRFAWLIEQWNLPENQPLGKIIYSKPPIMSYKRGKSLKDKY